MLPRCPERWLILGCTLLAGCSGLEARLVPVSARLCGKDRAVEGFRYYMPRPYLVVPQRLDVYVERIPTVLVAKENVAGSEDPVCLAGLDKNGQPTFYTLKGEPISGPETLPTPRKLPKDDPAALPKALVEVDTNSSSPPSSTRVEPIKGSAAIPPPPSSTRPAADGHAALQLLRIVYLPDFEQQMAVRPCNFLAKNEFSLSFQDGWQLNAVNAVCDATDVPTQLLGTIRKLMPLTLPAPPSVASLFKAPLSLPQGTDAVHVCITRTQYVPPGVYPLHSPARAGGEMSSCPALLTALGVPLEWETTVHVLPRDGKGSPED